MKKVLLLAVLLLSAVCAQAQSSRASAGIAFNVGTESNVGFNLKAQYMFTSAIRGEFMSELFFKHGDLSMWDLNLNAHYLFKVAPQFKLYPIVGVTFTRWWGEFTRFGANVGAGAEYDVSSRVFLNLDIKYQIIADADQAVFALGVGYRF